MAALLTLDPSVQNAITTLRNKLGANGEAAMLIGVLAAAWNQLAVLYAESEQRHAQNVQGATSFLRSLGDNMRALRDQVAGADAQLQQLHTEISSKLGEAAGDVAKAKTVMKDIIEVYANFTGEVASLKKGIGSLAKSALTALNPALAGFVGPLVDRALG